MIQDQNKIDEFQLDLKQELDSVSDFDEACDIFKRVQKDAKNELDATEQEVAEMMESHWGLCAEIDDALCEVFPQQFDGR